MRQPQQTEKTVSQKANRILSITFLVFALILFRIWYLCIIEHEPLTQKARAPQKKSVIVKANRGTITDRFGKYLARNKVQYHASILYAPIRQLPRSEWVLTPSGSREKIFKRKKHINELSQLLGKILQIPSQHIEDLIYSKAALFPNVPFPIKKDISEKEFYQLKALEKDWAGLYAEASSKRYYPEGKTAGGIIGYMGAISQSEYIAFLEEKESLEHFLRKTEQGLPVSFPQGFTSIPEVWNRLLDIKERAYSFHDRLGKGGVEGYYEEELRGYHGRKVFYSDSRGNFLKELPGKKEPIPGKKISLSLSLELQEHAEKLLANNEVIREGKSKEFNWDTRSFSDLPQPWIKGGALVAMDPKTGDVLALASYPRFDPRDFIEDQQRITDKERMQSINRWLETETHLQELWEGEVDLERELVRSVKLKRFSQEFRRLTWENYLDFTLPYHETLKSYLTTKATLKEASTLLATTKSILKAFPEHSLGALLNTFYPECTPYPFKRPPPPIELSPEQIQFGRSCYASLDEIESNYEKALALDLMKILIKEEEVSKEVLEQLGSLSLEQFRELSLSFFQLEKAVYRASKEAFSLLDFANWREEEFKHYLKQKRKEEEDQKSYAHPWIDYLSKQENALFHDFWEKNQWSLILLTLRPEENSPPEELKSYLPVIEKALQTHQGALNTLQSACLSLSPSGTLSLIQTIKPFDALKDPLWGRYPNLRSDKGKQLEWHLASAYYPKYGFNYNRSHAFQLSNVLGSIFKIVTAYSGLMQSYMDCNLETPTPNDLNPLTVIDKVERLREGVWRVGYRLDGTPIPQVYKGGRIPRSAARNNGKLDIIDALATSSNLYFALLTTECLPNPEMLKSAAELFSFGHKTGIDLPGEFAGKIPQDLSHNKTGAYTFAIGQHTLLTTPLQVACMMSTIANRGTLFKPKAIQSISGQTPARNPAEVLYQTHYPFEEELHAIGIHFPLMTKLTHVKKQAPSEEVSPMIKRKIPIPSPVQKTIFKGMYKALHSEIGNGRKALIQNYRWDHRAYQDYLKALPTMLGKTSTSQVPDRVGIDLNKPSHMYKSIWFGSIGFDEKEEPEIVVIAYLRYGDAGHEAIPIAASMIEKWRSIKKNSL